MLRLQRNKFDLGSLIKSKKLESENRNLNTKKKKEIIFK